MKEMTPQECRQLREFIDVFAYPNVLNREEYTQIMFALKSCADRMEKDGRVNYGRNDTA